MGGMCTNQCCLYQVTSSHKNPFTTGKRDYKAPVHLGTNEVPLTGGHAMLSACLIPSYKIVCPSLTLSKREREREWGGVSEFHCSHYCFCYYYYSFLSLVRLSPPLIMSREYYVVNLLARPLAPPATISSRGQEMLLTHS